MTTLEAQPDWKRMDIQKQINELMGDISRWESLTADDRPVDTSRRRMERDRIARIANALQCARDCE